jgi:hypothetical protein
MARAGEFRPYPDITANDRGAPFRSSALSTGGGGRWTLGAGPFRSTRGPTAAALARLHLGEWRMKTLISRQSGWTRHLWRVDAATSRSTSARSRNMKHIALGTAALVAFAVVSTSGAEARNRTRVDQYGYNNGAAAYQQGDGNSAVAVQKGSVQYSRGVQTGYRNFLRMDQYGSRNHVTTAQRGDDNYAVTGQDGRNLRAETTQSGFGNVSGIAQIGAGNVATATQDGVGHASGIIQVGSGQTAQVRQAGTGNITVVVQGGEE